MLRDPKQLNKEEIKKTLPEEEEDDEEEEEIEEEEEEEDEQPTLIENNTVKPQTGQPAANRGADDKKQVLAQIISGSPNKALTDLINRKALEKQQT